MKKHLLAAVAALVMVADASAVSTASASITGFSFTLFDLDPNDGITPALTFTGQGSSTFAYSQITSDNDFAAGWFAPVQSAVSTSPWFATATVSPSGATAGASNGGTLTPGEWAYAYGFAYPVQGLVGVTPKTGVIFTTFFSGTATTTVGRVGDDSESAYASGYVGLSVSEPNGGQSFTAYREVFANYVASGATFLGESKSFAGAVELSYANLTNGVASGSLFAYSTAQANSLLPVPEPSAWLLMLAGVVGLAFFSTLKR